MVTNIKKPVIVCISIMAVLTVLLWSCTKTDTDPLVLVPTIGSVSPTSGFIGDEVTITGTNFNTAAIYNEVIIGGVTTIATSSTSTSLTALVPAGAVAGSVDLAVKAYGVTTDPLTFTVIWPPPVVTGSIPGYGNPGDEITIYGLNFSSNPDHVSVSFDGSPATVTATSGISVTVEVPAGTTTGDVTVTIVGQESNAMTFFVPVNPATVEYLVVLSANDVEESLDRDDGHTESGSGDLDMGKFDTNQTPDMGNNICGVRHPGVMVPQGATIISAYLQCQAYNSGSDPTQMTIYGDASDDAGILDEGTIPYGLSSRTKTTANAVWDIPAWIVDERGDAQKTPDLRAIIQEIVDRPGWVSGNAMCFMLYPSGVSVGRTLDDGVSGREANGGTDDGPSLVIIYEQ